MSSHNSQAFRSLGHRPVGKGSPARRHLSRCPNCNKVRFRDKQEALDAVHAAVTNRRFAEVDGSSTARQERRAYPCSSCHGWHLTSQESRGDANPTRSPVTQSNPTFVKDKASGPRRVFLAIRKDGQDEKNFDTL